MCSSITLVTAVTPSHLGKLRWCLPTWKIKPQFRDCRLLIYYHGWPDGEAPYAAAALWGENVELINWRMPQAENDRERMISAFVLGAAEHVETDFFVKLDADCWFEDAQDVFDLSDFGLDLVAHRWGYTKPAHMLDAMDRWSKGKRRRKYPESRAKVKHPRIQSFCCLHRTSFVDAAAELAGDRLPVPSHDTYLWWLAENVNEFSWRGKNLHKLGVGHNAREKKCREGACSSVGTASDALCDRLFEHVQLEITTACNLACPNCDRNCGEAPSAERMSVDQVRRAVDEWLAGKCRWRRVDILGGEPTLHPELGAILAEVYRYKEAVPTCRMRLTTNGTGEKVARVIAGLPDWLKVRNSADEKKRPNFEAVNVAPADLGVKNPKACSIPWRCGLALTRYGYYLCGAGAGICRVFGFPLAAKSLADLTPDLLRRQQTELCRLCGHSRSTVKVTDKREVSPTWEAAFKAYMADPVRLEAF